ncbi:hypothetical protein RISK_004087 [Rhodopirellula islandica]|uniref:Uncharacterized protein n=1 Tax=Rhodopirellula islandica TaxID=595434 RepID=A0A0J1BAD5_RHOIS|nr:hypothetical protein RISK_004087 [Rhodopirellula islandica]
MEARQVGVGWAFKAEGTTTITSARGRAALANSFLSRAFLGRVWVEQRMAVWGSSGRLKMLPGE